MTARQTFRAALLTLALPGAALAGIPTEEEMTCPVGGESFTITGTMSCTSFGPAFLSMAPRTSCDFVTKLPQCPSNGLPLYRDFTADEIGVLEGLVESADYQAVRAGHSRFYLAWWVAQELGDDDPAREFFLLLQGLWWDTETAMADPEHLAALRAELEATIPGTPAEEQAIHYGIGGYVSALMGEFDAAAEWRDKATEANADFGNEMVTGYIEALGRCIESGDPAAPACAPRQPD